MITPMDEPTNYIDFPIFMVSIDTELIWGVADKPNHIAYSLMNKYPDKTRKIFSDLLQLFEKYNIPVTWATVGHLFLERCEGHACLRAPSNNWYEHDPCTDIDANRLHYGLDIIEEIMSNKVNHEIGYHTFSHANFARCSKDVANDEIKEGKKLAAELGIKLRSFVFPRNEIGQLDILKENGFEIFRGTNIQRWDPKQRFFHRMFNGAADKCFVRAINPIWRNGIWEVPSSMQFMDFQIPSSLMIRSFFGLENAIKNNNIFHIYFHPYDFLIKPCLATYLDKLLASVAKKRSSGKLQVMTMGDLASYLNRKKQLGRI